MKNSNMYLGRRWYGISRKWFENESVMVRERVENDSVVTRLCFGKILAVLAIIFTLGVGNVWGADPVATETVATGKSFVVACWTGSKYVALPHITTGGTYAGTDITVNASGKVTTADAPEWTFTKNPSNANQFYLTYTSSGTTYYLYKNGTKKSNYNIAGKSNGDKNYWTFTKSGSAYNVIAVDRGTYNTRLTYYVSGSKWEVYGTAATADIILLEKASACTSWSDPTVTYSATTLTAGGAHATVSVSGTTYGTRTFSSSDDDILTVNSTTGEVTPVSNGNASVTVSWAGNATYCSKDVVIDFTVNKAPATIKLSEAGAESTVSGTHYSGDTYTLPSTTEATCGTKVLVGWSTVTVEETDTKPTSNFYEKGESVTLSAGENKFYAVFATSSGGGGGAAVNTTMWSEDFSTKVTYNSATVTYEYTDGNSDTKTYSDNYAGGTSPELLIGKSGGAWEITGIPVGGAATLTLSYRMNNTNISEATTSTANVSIGSRSGSNPYTQTITISGSVSTFDLTFANSASSNGRIDDISVKVATQAGSFSAYSTSCAACAADPTIGTAQLKGSFNLSNFLCSCRF